MYNQNRAKKKKLLDPLITCQAQSHTKKLEKLFITKYPNNREKTNATSVNEMSKNGIIFVIAGL